MKVFLSPVGLYSHAMVRVADALIRHKPKDVEIVRSASAADLTVLHVIGPGSFEGVDLTRPHAIIQYCFKSAGLPLDAWPLIWAQAKLVWSYYDLDQYTKLPINFYYAPLGVDPTFTQDYKPGFRDVDVMTSGYVSGPISEAIAEVATAAELLGFRVLHLGPQTVEGMAPVKYRRWHAVCGIDDSQLASDYRRTRLVSGLRHVEGFELPALEGLACGARPIVFDRPEMRAWYQDWAVFVPECSGEELVQRLLGVLPRLRAPISQADQEEVRRRFDWEPIARRFWEGVL